MVQLAVYYEEKYIHLTFWIIKTSPTQYLEWFISLVQFGFREWTYATPPNNQMLEFMPLVRCLQQKLFSFFPLALCVCVRTSVHSWVCQSRTWVPPECTYSSACQEEKRTSRRCVHKWCPNGVPKWSDNSDSAESDVFRYEIVVDKSETLWCKVMYVNRILADSVACTVLSKIGWPKIPLLSSLSHILIPTWAREIRQGCIAWVGGARRSSSSSSSPLFRTHFGDRLFSERWP